MPNILQKLIACVLIIIFSPIFVIVSFIILFSDGFPIIFKQERIGLNGKKFKCFKFRTMRKNAEEILYLPDVNGGLIGGASLNAAKFAMIANICNK